MTGLTRCALTSAALLAAASCTRPPAVSTAAAARYVSVTNLTGSNVNALYLSPHDAPTWEENLLGTDVLADGESLAIRLDAPALPARWDVRADGAGRHAEWRDLDLRRASTITLRVDGRVAVAELEAAR